MTGCKIIAVAARDYNYQYSQGLELARSLKWINGIFLVSRLFHVYKK